jgi:putative transposase
MAHLIFVCKYRKPLLDKFGDEIKHIMSTVAEDKGIEILDMEVDKDHIHILISYSPSMAVLEIVRLFKQITTYRIWRQNDNGKALSKHYWAEKTFWSDGYFACSTGQVSKAAIEKHIQTHGYAIHPLP